MFLMICFPLKVLTLLPEAGTEVEEISGTPIPSHLRIYHETPKKPS